MISRALFPAIVFVLLIAAPARAGQPQLLDASFQSPSLSRFFGKPTYMHAQVLLPDSYYKNSDGRFPVIYVVPAFDGPYQVNAKAELDWKSASRRLHREFIVIFLEAMVNINGEELHHQFVDSANDGPWGTALTSEFIPETDAHFRTIAQPSARFLFGHSSGGWSVLWLQVNYPDEFGGVWSISPDPVDFHDFLGPDITKAPQQNFYHDDAGHEYGIWRNGTGDLTTIRLLIQRKYWARRQFDTYDEVFSPRRSNGYPAPLFDRKTGVIDPSVAAYWEQHYDITHLLEERWEQLGPKLAGKIHVFVGTQDTFHLDGPVRRMQFALALLGSDAEFGFAPGADHWTVFSWQGGLIGYAMGEMSSKVPPAAAAAYSSR
jgi:S-formylglutathione hydrolase FrmB